MPRVFHRRSGASGSQKVFIATPTTGMTAAYASSVFNSAQALERAGIPTELCLMEGNPDIGDARNELVGEFLKTDCTDLVFIDADLYWEAKDLVHLVQYDRDVVAGVYPTKDSSESRFPARLIAGDQWTEADGLLEVEAVPGGFLRIKRHVIEGLAKESDWFQPNGVNSQDKVPLIFMSTFEDGEKWGEDFTFCRKWRKAGGKIYINPEWRFQHYGLHVWQDSFGAHLRRRQNISLSHCMKQISDGRDTLNTYLELHRTWDNGAWAAGPDMLMVIAGLARKGGPIIEFGTGLSTIVARAANPTAEIVAYDHSGHWALKVDKAIREAGYPEVHIKVTDLVGFPPFYEINEERRFMLAICDGPPHREDEDRSLTYPNLTSVLAPGGRIVVDDLHFPDARENFESWAKSAGADYRVADGEKLFGIATIPEDRLEAAE